MTQTFVERLEPLAREGDLEGARALLDDLAGDQLREARKWFAANRRWFSELLISADFAGQDHETRFLTRNAACWIAGMCAVRLAGPVMAASRVPWRYYWDYREDPGEAAFVHLLWDTDQDWAASFVEAASHVRLGTNARNCQEQLARVLRAVALHHRLPCPPGSTFVDRWWSGTGCDPSTTDGLADALARDPFMPDLLPLYLSSGNCGDLPALPEAVARLVERGVVGRTDVLEHVLQTLTAPQRPRSQKVLAEITTRLGLTAAEVPGGLTYLLGVLATADRSVAPALLPVAVEAVTTPADLEELAGVVAARPEKRTRTMLLAALTGEGVRGAFGRTSGSGSPGGGPDSGSLLAALGLLRTGEDAAFDAKVDRAAARLGGWPEEPDAAAAPLGLWELTPAVSEPAPLADEADHRAPLTWDDVLDSTCPGRARSRPRLVDRTLRSVADGTFDPVPLLASFRVHLDLGRLGVRSLCSVLEDLFLGGALRQVWPTALTMADEASASPRLAGLADLLGLLSRYAPELPHPWGVPPRVRDLALRTGSTRVVAEARTLVSALLRLPAPVPAEVLVAAAPPAPVPPSPRGLWARRPPKLPAAPSNRRLVPPGEMEGLDDLDEVRHRLGDELSGPADTLSGTYLTRHPDPRRGVWSADLALAAVVRAVHVHGPQPVRAAVAEVKRYAHLPPVDVLAAVDVWAAGALDVEACWRLATASVVTDHDLVYERRADPDFDWAGAEERRRTLPPLAERLRHSPGRGEPLVVPRELASGAERLHFLRAAEALIRAESHCVMLSTPTWADGTLELDDLLARLAAVRDTPGATVGPVDLVQALHRLRPVDRERAADVPDGPCTDPRFTSRSGGESWDAGALVRHWVAAGGLPDLEPRFDEASGWRSEAVAPVPFARLDALPPDLRGDSWRPGPVRATARMMPLWPDRSVGEAFAQVGWFAEHLFPGHLAGGGGLPLHDLLVAVLESDGGLPGNHGRRSSWLAAGDFAQRRRLVPHAFATAGLMRHRRGVLRLGALTSSLRLALEVPGAFSWWWVSAMTLGEGLSRAEHPPAELAGLLRLLALYAAEVPSTYLASATPGVVALAGSEADDTLRAAAAELVAALARSRG